MISMLYIGPLMRPPPHTPPHTCGLNDSAAPPTAVLNIGTSRLIEIWGGVVGAAFGPAALPFSCNLTRIITAVFVAIGLNVFEIAVERREACVLF